MYLEIKEGRKITITFEEFRKKYTICFTGAMPLPMRKHNGIIPSDYNKQIFIKQLLDVGDLLDSDIEDMINYTKMKFMMANNLNDWLHDNELSDEQKDNFFKQTITIWKGIHKAKHRANMRAAQNGQLISNDQIMQASVACLDDIRTVELNIEGQRLDPEMSNGQFYLLSDQPLIGWHQDWELMYKKP